MLRKNDTDCVCLCVSGCLEPLCDQWISAFFPFFLLLSVSSSPVDTIVIELNVNAMTGLACVDASVVM